MDIARRTASAQPLSCEAGTHCFPSWVGTPTWRTPSLVDSPSPNEAIAVCHAGVGEHSGNREERARKVASGSPCKKISPPPDRQHLLSRWQQVGHSTAGSPSATPTSTAGSTASVGVPRRCRRCYRSLSISRTRDRCLGLGLFVLEAPLQEKGSAPVDEFELAAPPLGLGLGLLVGALQAGGELAVGRRTGRRPSGGWWDNLNERTSLCIPISGMCCANSSQEEPSFPFNRMF